MQAKKHPISAWAKDDRPREKLLDKGPYSLSDAELIAILIQHGNREWTAVDLAREVLRAAHNNLFELGKLSAHDLQQIRGIGTAKALMVLAALELGRRRHASKPREKFQVKDSRDVAAFLKVMLQDASRELFVVVFLNQANLIKHHEIISMGGITGTVADPRLILKKALEQEATALILCHNHPSGNLKPSQADTALTQKIKTAASYIDIKVMDHVIVSENGYFSFADEGML
jgi:DNA repair protein RadC